MTLDQNFNAEVTTFPAVSDVNLVCKLVHCANAMFAYCDTKVMVDSVYEYGLIFIDSICCQRFDFLSLNL